MPIRITYDEEIDSLVIKVTHVVTREDILSSLDQLINHPRFRKNINQLFDCTEGTLDFTMQDLENVASYFTSLAEQLGHHRKLAITAPGDLNFGMMRQYYVFFDSGPGVSLNVFRSLSEARKWLKNEYK